MGPHVKLKHRAYLLAMISDGEARTTVSLLQFVSLSTHGASLAVSRLEATGRGHWAILMLQTAQDGGGAVVVKLVVVDGMAFTLLGFAAQQKASNVEVEQPRLAAGLVVQL